MDSRGPEKKERLLAALDGGMVMIHLDARRPGVVVPAHLKEEVHLRLNLSYKFDPADLSVGDWGVRCTLSFGGSRATVAVPWSALFAVASHVTREFWLFPEDMPPELLQHAQQGERVAPSSGPRAVPEQTRPAPALTPVEGGRPPSRPVLREVTGEETPTEPPPPPSRGHLRLVK
ncbi:MAG: ClpXP protease specificity-enhancing factor SspB [Myxococcaceae bacterium]|nr:ClpXP protease specificity-enhancing factor SspB [Myxococcaceae bacterium]MCI0673778.1 ClpXP protease specificity-enhancing factor SspB [Myxococcaceae bacterium]